ncbi:interferon-induced protein 44-like [Genypterus blacodes]|uniref:interferon-induced protein 44-like n=1 Tax=Genypterus blacodes TaxID=154954 RepID=UPI003F766282
MGGGGSTPWREIIWDENNTLFRKVNNYTPGNKDVHQLRILLHGPVGAGKSSFINSVTSTLHSKISVKAGADAMSGQSYTTRYRTYKISIGTSEHIYPFVFNDIMGLEEASNRGVSVEDIKLAMKGHVKEGYTFKYGSSISKNDPHFIKSPTLDDRVHILVCVIPIDTLSLLSEGLVQKMREVRLAAGDMGIPQIAILTKIDVDCPTVKSDTKNAYKEEYLQKKAEQFSLLLGLPLNCIFLVKNYSSETRVNADVDTLILSALGSILDYGDDFLKDPE